MGLKSKYDVLTEDLVKKENIKDIALTKVKNKNRVLLLEKMVKMKMLKNKGRKESNSFRQVLEVLK